MVLRPVFCWKALVVVGSSTKTAKESFNCSTVLLFVPFCWVVMMDMFRSSSQERCPSIFSEAGEKGRQTGLWKSTCAILGNSDRPFRKNKKEGLVYVCSYICNTISQYMSYVRCYMEFDLTQASISRKPQRFCPSILLLIRLPDVFFELY